MGEWTELVKGVGVSAAFAIGLALALWRSVVWIASNLVKPMIDRHIKFLDNLDASMEKMCETLQGISDRQDSHENKLDELSRLFERNLQTGFRPGLPPLQSFPPHEEHK
jgi:hypothetical protein